MLDGGPARIPKSSDRRGDYRRSSSSQPAPEPSASTSHEPKPIQQPRVESAAYYSQPKKEDPKNGLLKPLAIILSILIIIAIATGSIMYFLSRGDNNPGIDQSKYQAVFFSTGQAYFGKLEMLSDTEAKLTDVFYIQSNPGDITSTDSPEGEAATAESAGTMQLIKLGEELHAPDDQLIINRDQILFYENIRPEGRVQQLIDDYKSGSN